MSTPFVDRTGMRFGFWTVLRVSRVEKGKPVVWLCRCDCGVEKPVIVRSLIDGLSKSCGCKAQELRVPKVTKHGLAGTPTYKSWHSMFQRADGKGGHESYPARGISVCARWKDFSAFVSDMGLRPEGKTIDRIDNTKGYSPDNCRWATPKEQQNNRDVNVRFSVFGELLTVSEAADRYGIGGSAIRHRLHKGVPPEIAMTVKHFRKEMLSA